MKKCKDCGHRMTLPTDNTTLYCPFCLCSDRFVKIKGLLEDNKIVLAYITIQKTLKDIRR